MGSIRKYRLSSTDMASLTDTFWLVSSACVTAKIAFLAFFTLSSIIFFMFPFLLIVIPRYLYVFTYSRLASPSINGLSVAFPADMIINWVFFVFMVNPHLSQYPFSFSRQAEARAILLALECIEHSNRKRFLIFTDSMSCLQALDHLKFDHPIIEEIISKLMSLKASGFDIHLCWLPGHVGILGNERADRAAKAARRTDMQPCLIPPSDIKPIIRKHITAMWQATWDESPLNKLHEIAPIVNEPRTHHLSTRRDQSVFNRCRIGHSRLTHEFLLKGGPPPECIPCNCLLTIKHLLIECVDFNDVRQRFYQVPSLQDLFKTVKPEVILEFLKAAALYRLL